jgi:hypothetical protein
VASLQDDSVGVATALSPVGAGHFKFYHTTFIVGLGLTQTNSPDHRNAIRPSAALSGNLAYGRSDLPDQEN